MMKFKLWFENTTRRGFLRQAAATVGALAGVGNAASEEKPINIPDGDEPFPAGSSRDEWSQLVSYLIPFTDSDTEKLHLFLRFAHGATMPRAETKPGDFAYTFRGQLMSKITTEIKNDDPEGKAYLIRLLTNPRTGRRYSLPPIEYAAAGKESQWDFEKKTATIVPKSILKMSPYGTAAHELSHGLQTPSGSDVRNPLGSSIHEIIGIIDGVRELYHDKLRRKRLNLPSIEYSGEIVFPSGHKEDINELVNLWGKAGSVNAQPIHLLFLGRRQIHFWVYNMTYEQRKKNWFEELKRNAGN